jgi:hypothetical protein
VEHHHRCVYCRTEWSCHEECPLAGPSVCTDCREKLADAPPGTPYRVIPLDRATRILGSLVEHEADRLTRELKRRQRPE